MEPVAKKTKLTDHFRKVLKPRDPNILGASNNNNLNNNNKLISDLNLGKQSQSQSQAQAQAHHQHLGHSSQTQLELADRRSSRENLQIENLPRKEAYRKKSPKKVEIITIDEDDEATEIDENYAEQSQSRLIPKRKLAEARHRIFNYDESVLDNVLWEPHYACDSFDYDRKQELKFLVNRCDIDIKPAIRAELVDWLVALQVRYSLDHEPLYMAVKLADLYLMQKCLSDDKFVLLYLTTIFIAAKFDERQTFITMPMLIKQAKDKFGIKYTVKNIVELEVDLLTTLDFNLRFPLSYGFLRRFARCTRSDMRTINLARYILESSLMDYEMIETLESEIAAGSLLLAHEMLHHTKAWNATARHYTGYEERELFPLIIRLNKMLLKFSRKKTAIRRKYSHEMFMEVAKIPPILPELLLLMTSDQQPR